MKRIWSVLKRHGDMIMLKIIVCTKQAYNQEVANGIQEYFDVYKKSAEIKATTQKFQNIMDLVDTQEKGGNDFLIILSELDDESDIVEQTCFLRKHLFSCYIIFISENKNLLESLTNHNTMISGFYEYPFIDESFQNGLDNVFMCLDAREQESLKGKFAIECKDLKTQAKKIIYKDMDEILYIEATDKKIRYVTSSLVYSEKLSKHEIQYNAYSNKGSLSSIEKVLDSKIFYRCHNSYIVNINAIREYISNNFTLILVNGDCVLVSRGKKKRLEEGMALITKNK